MDIYYRWDSVKEVYMIMYLEKATNSEQSQSLARYASSGGSSQASTTSDSSMDYAFDNVSSPPMESPRGRAPVAVMAPSQTNIPTFSQTDPPMFSQADLSMLSQTDLSTISQCDLPTLSTQGLMDPAHYIFPSMLLDILPLPFPDYTQESWTLLKSKKYFPPVEEYAPLPLIPPSSHHILKRSQPRGRRRISRNVPCLWLQLDAILALV